MGKSLPNFGALSLEFPIEHGGATITDLKLRRPKMGDELRKSRRRKSGASDEEIEMRMFADMLELGMDVIEEMDQVDYQALQEVYQSFFPKAQKKS